MPEKNFDGPPMPLDFDTIARVYHEDDVMLWARQVALPVEVKLIRAYITGYDMTRVLVRVADEPYNVRAIADHRLHAYTEYVWCKFAMKLLEMGITRDTLEHLLDVWGEAEGEIDNIHAASVIRAGRDE